MDGEDLLYFPQVSILIDPHHSQINARLSLQSTLGDKFLAGTTPHSNRKLKGGDGWETSYVHHLPPCNTTL